MFVRYFEEIDRPFAEVEAALLSAPRTWMPGVVRAAGDREDMLLSEVGVPVGGRRVDKDFAIQVRDPMRLPFKTTLPTNWKADGATALFPEVDADIELTRLGRERTQLAVSARYTPPLGAVGRTLDRALLHGIAEASVKDFVARLAATLRQLSLPAEGVLNGDG